MAIIVLILFLVVLVSVACLIIGLIKPTIFSRFMRGEITRKKTTKIFGMSAVVFFGLVIILAEKISTEKAVPTKNEKEITSQPTAGVNSLTQQKDIKSATHGTQSSQVSKGVSADEAHETGLKYYRGEGVKQDYQEALKWWRKAADQGNIKAQYNIGLMYDYGIGVAQNNHEARKWYQKAADQGDIDSQAAIIRGMLNTPNQHVLEKEFLSIVNGEKDVNAVIRDGKRILHYVCGSSLLNDNALEYAKFLINIGADINVRDKDGMTPLQNALIACPDEVTKLLLNNGADVNTRSYKSGRTPLMSASGIIKTDRPEIVSLLIDRGADVNASDKSGLTPLICASKFGNIKTVRLLCDKGADVNAKDSGGKTALTYATALDQIEVVKILLDKGADIDPQSLYFASYKIEMQKLFKARDAK